MFATYEFYTQEYLLGKEAVIRAADFPYFARKAGQVIKEYTFDNIKPDMTIPEPVKMCCCELAEVLQAADRARTDTGRVKSETVGKQSVSYVAGDEFERVQKQKEVRVIRSWLANTGLLYRGVNIC